MPGDERVFLCTRGLVRALTETVSDDFLHMCRGLLRVLGPKITKGLLLVY